MADISDVMNVLAATCASYVYPNGTSEPSVTGGLIRVFEGWPTASSLDADLQDGVVNVSIYPTGPENNVTRYQPKQLVQSVVTPTLTLTQNGNQVTVGGTMLSPYSVQNMAVIINGTPFIYPVQETDTLTSIATGLTALISPSYPGTNNDGPVITLPAGAIPSAVRVGTTGVATTEWERQKQRIQITVWAPDPTTRTQVSSAIRVALSQIAFLTMPDGFGARIKSAGSMLSDVLEKAKTYRRDLFYEVEYATTVAGSVTTIVATKTSITPNP